MKIQLDTNAMNALFPEGSEARVELQNAVIANFARRTQDKYISAEVQKTVRETVGDAMHSYEIDRKAREAVTEMFTQTNSYWNASFAVKNGSKLSTAIREYANKLVIDQKEKWQKEGESSVRVQVKHAQEDLDHHAKRIIDNEIRALKQNIETLVRADINNIIRAELQKVLSSGQSVLGTK